MKAQAAPALPATPSANLSLVGSAAEARALTALERFEEAIQSVLDTPLDPVRVFEWTRLRAVSAAS
ncbi:MAG: hypothetical protein M3271_10530 [Actinomycetota bacterium]|nr:hypothetical protein [Actinomycetota bacterium]